MSGDEGQRGEAARYEPVEKAGVFLAAGLGLQLAILVLAAAVMIPTVVFRAAGETDALVSWAVFAALVCCGATTVLQALRAGRVGAGYIMVTGTSGAAIAASITALTAGGPATLVTLMLFTALLQLALAARLTLFRRILTPTVTGAVIMLIPVSVMPVVARQMEQVPEGVPASAAPMTVIATVCVMAVFMLKGNAVLRLWAPVIGIAAGTITGAFYGIYDLEGVATASWFGPPSDGWPGFELDFGSSFWALLPAFAFVTLIGMIQTISGSVAIQRVSWRPPRAVDYRSVQNAVATGGFGNVLAGLAGTMPITTLSTGASMAELTGVAARSVGVALGTWLIFVAFFPKALALVLAIPGPAIAAYVAVMMAMLFMIGLKLVMQDGIDYRKSAIVGIAFWTGVVLQHALVFPEFVAEFGGGVLNNGMTAGGFVAIALTIFIELTEPRRLRLKTKFGLGALPEISGFLRAFANRSGWGEEMADRLDAVGEETLLTLVRQDDTGEEEHARRQLLVSARKEGGGAALEFLASTNEENVQDRISLMGEQASEVVVEREISLRLLRHLATSVRHQQYHDTDVLTVRVEAPGPARGSGR